MPDVHERIEQLLVEEIGPDNGESPWREELLEHLVESYETAISNGGDPERAWREVLERFGNLRRIDEELELIHTTTVGEWLLRLLSSSLFLIAASAIGIFNLWGFVDPVSFMYVVMGPGMAVGIYLLWKRRLSWNLNRIPWRTLEVPCLAGSLAGMAFGMSNILLYITDISRIGPPLAIILLCALYGTILTRPRLPLLILMASGCLICHAALVPFFDFSPFDFSAWTVPDPFPFAAGLSLTLIGGFLFYGKPQFLERLPQLGLIGMIAVQILYLQRLEDPHTYLPAISLSLVPLLLWMAPRLGTRTAVGFSTSE